MTLAGGSTLYFAVLDSLPLGVMVLDRDMRVVHWNACLEDWTGIVHGEIVGSDIRERLPHFGEPRYATRLTELFSGGAPTVFSSQLHPHIVPARLRSGRLRVQHTVAVALPADDGTYTALLAIQDVTNLADAMDALRVARDDAKRQAASDPLTGVANRRHFVELSERTVAQSLRHGRPCALLSLDIDSFKPINDTYGHAVGDAVLRAFVSTCRGALREYDLLGRLGGDEFAVLLPETSTAMALVTGERLRAAIQGEVFNVENRSFRISVSVGVVALDETSRTIDELLKRADSALYEAKNAGRNRVVAG